MAVRKEQGSVGAKQGDAPKETRLDTDVNAPATTASGDAPFDTTDPTENASTITPQVPSDEAIKAGTILGAIPVAAPAGVPDVDPKDVRTEEYDAIKPDGTKVRVRLYLDGPNQGRSEIV
jgi:hypothetical protein